MAELEDLRFSIRRWIEGCEASLTPFAPPFHLQCFSIRRWIEGCEAQVFDYAKRGLLRVSVSADGSKGVKRARTFGGSTSGSSFSIRRWIEGCEAVKRSNTYAIDANVSVSADGSKGVKRFFQPSPAIYKKCVSVSADGSKGVKLEMSLTTTSCQMSFSIRRWIEGCEAGCCPCICQRDYLVSVSADGSKGVKHLANEWRSRYGKWVSVSADGSKGVKL